MAEELAILGGKKDLGDHLATVLLLRGDYLLTDPGRQDEGRALVRQALELKRHLSAADAEYARGLLTRRGDEALAHFRAANRLDAERDVPHVHHRSRSALVTTLLCLGHLAEARREAEFMRQIFREDPLPIFVEACVDLLEGKRELKARLKQLRSKLDESQVEALRDLFHRLGRVLDVVEGMNAAGGGLSVADQVTLLVEVAKLVAVARGAAAPLGFHIPTASFALETWEAAKSALAQAQFGDTAGAVEFLTQATERQPDALLLFLTAFLRLRLVDANLRGGRSKEARAHLEALADEANQALTAPTFLPRALFRYQARMLAVFADAKLIGEFHDRFPQRQARVRDHLGWLMIEGRQHPGHREKVTALLMPVLDVEQARALLTGWQVDEPESLPALRLRAELEWKARDHLAARDAASRVLKKDPANKRMIEIRDGSVKALQELRRTPAGPAPA